MRFHFLSKSLHWLVILSMTISILIVFTGCCEDKSVNSPMIVIDGH